MAPRCSRSSSWPIREPAEGEVVVEVARAGMNFADTHQRENDYLAKAELR